MKYNASNLAGNRMSAFVITDLVLIYLPGNPHLLSFQNKWKQAAKSITHTFPNSEINDVSLACFATNSKLISKCWDIFLSNNYKSVEHVWNNWNLRHTSQKVWSTMHHAHATGIDLPVVDMQWNICCSATPTTPVYPLPCTAEMISPLITFLCW